MLLAPPASGCIHIPTCPLAHPSATKYRRRVHAFPATEDGSPSVPSIMTVPSGRPPPSRLSRSARPVLTSVCPWRPGRVPATGAATSTRGATASNDDDDDDDDGPGSDASTLAAEAPTTPASAAACFFWKRRPRRWKELCITVPHRTPGRSRTRRRTPRLGALAYAHARFLTMLITYLNKKVQVLHLHSAAFVSNSRILHPKR